MPASPPSGPGAAPGSSPTLGPVTADGTTRGAARLSPAAGQLSVTADPTAVRAAGRQDDVRVLTDRDRRYTDSDPERDSDALLAGNALPDTSRGVT